MSGLRPSVAIANRLNKTIPVMGRFWKFVDKHGPLHPVHGRCWKWVGATNKDGYGHISENGKLISAPIIAYRELVAGIPYGHFVCHHCDNPGCVNPDHLFTGTNKDNNDDKERKGRGNHPKGEANGRAKLTADKVRYARQVFIKGHYRFGIAALARKFNVSEFVMAEAIKGHLWKSVK